ncbi:ABC transporter ATP-binding protein [Ethanoligenens harbinense]|uniref:ABC transporter related protein n=1 Tax=Ethanoligenens harbinense (strain DSM 18485 / JCM 12961 / CGMCC 1.5033 / YUAN-3) TaxID=663278 RepID=E6U945_ETHHY|nr:ABC transporter ATP-binding protein [Ethanoligenens harbinense]ADU26109.1 ABC transporter related protein [Ethanoligenens harbinense YUAN-3]AVQ95254.1 ABC transporter ATP-binding protein [Ethanoligenens harbinense YUAN-3]AYF40665.1 ABC transporter ATP-binding protein [Ethanoligenens harbinense]QCN91499.1 ABC transporter ATP-binding protein [Ethanoligenens harbinense]
MELKIENLSKQYKKRWAVNNFSISIGEGVYGLLGPNGAGKSTLMRMLVDILKPTSGRVLLDNQDIHQMGDSYRDVIGYLPQNFGVYKNFTAHRFLLYLASLKGISRREAEPKIDHLLKFVNLEEMKSKKIHTFSGGMKQRLGIAQALLNDPAILILDEPTTGLDPNERIRFRNLLSELSSNKIVLLSTHIVSDVEYIAKDVIVMKKGQLLRQAPSAELIDEMQGKVWKVKVTESRLMELKQQYVIGNILRHKHDVEVKIIADEAPEPGAISTEPDLEDYYLYHFGEEAIQDGTFSA